MSLLRTHARTVLAQLAPELSAALTPLVERTARALGPLHSPQELGRGEPDGYAGIARAPSYERLLASEWLLADEAPDEFLRRAAQREQAAYVLGHKVPRTRQRCLVRIESGPRCLGLPRIAMLAALIALEQRARRAGVEFAWSSLEAPEHVHTGIHERAQARAFLDARTAASAALEGLSEGDANDELWLLGSSATLAAAPRRAQRMSFAQVWGEQRIDVTIAQGVNAARELRLDLPSDPLCVRLLRDPFAAEAPVAPAPSAQLRGEVLFAGRGHRLLNWDYARRQVNAYCVPSHPGAQSGRVRFLRSERGEGLIGAAYIGRLLVLKAIEDALLLYGLPGPYANERRAGRSVLTLPMDGALGYASPRLRPCLVLLGKHGQVATVTALERGGTLFAGTRDHHHAFVRPERLIACFQGGRREQAVWLTEKGSALELNMQVPNEAEWQTHARIDLPAPDQVFFDCAQDASDLFAGHIALVHGSTVSVAALRPPGHPLAFRQLMVPDGARLIGMTFLDRSTPSLLVLEHNQTSFSLLNRGGAELIFHAPSRVDAAQVCPHSGVLAFRTERQWTLVDPARRRTLLTFACEAGA